MQRLSRYLKKIGFFNNDNTGLFTSRLNALQLQPGEFVHQTIPYESWIFIEDGLLVELHTRNKKKATTVRIHFQGRSLEYSQCVYGQNPLGKRILKAVEVTTLYYMTPMISDDVTLGIFYSAITHAMTKSNLFERNFRTLHYSKNTLKKTHRIIKNYPSLLRVPAHNLYDYLSIKSAHQKKLIRNAQSLYRKSHHLPLYPKNIATDMLSPTSMQAYALNNLN